MKHIRLYEDFLNEAAGYKVLVYTNPSMMTEPIKGTTFDVTGESSTDLIAGLDGDDADTGVIFVPKKLAKNQKDAEKLVQKHYASDFDAKWIAMR